MMIEPTALLTLLVQRGQYFLLKRDLPGKLFRKDFDLCMLSVDLLLQEANDLRQLSLLDLLSPFATAVIHADHLFQHLPDHCTAPSRLETHLTIINLMPLRKLVNKMHA